MSAIFTISLDFELHWGNFDKWDAPAYHDYFINTRQKAIPGMLRLFEKYGVHCTWATVGTLMHHNKTEFEANLPAVWPNYVQKELGMKHFLDKKGIGNNEEEDPYHYAPSLIRQIIATKGQELATHTFAHYFCNEPGQTIEAFTADLHSAVKVQRENWGSSPKSIVFPRNQYSPAHIETCKRMGLTSIRSNPNIWWWKITRPAEETKLTRLMRGADAYLPLGGPFSYPLSAIKKQEGIWALPASRLLRPYSAKFKFLEKFRLRRIMKEMSFAAKHQQVYHLWWHPHNFGNHPEQNLAALETILAHFQDCHTRYGMQSLTMAETAALLDQESH